jgi:YHS domain-containing protein
VDIPLGAAAVPRSEVMIEFFEYLTDAILLLITLRMLYGALRQFLSPRVAAHGGRAAEGRATRVVTSPGAMVRDPECGIFVSTEVSHRLKRDGETLHFCSEECLQRYRQRPS